MEHFYQTLYTFLEVKWDKITQKNFKYQLNLRYNLGIHLLIKPKIFVQ